MSRYLAILALSVAALIFGCCTVLAFKANFAPPARAPECDAVCCCGCVDGSKTCGCPEEPEDELAGFWWVHETKKDEPRQGIVCLHKGKGEAYMVTWCYNPGVLQGVALRVGDKLAVSWMEGPSKMGLMTYDIQRVGGGLHISGSTEVWTKAKPPKRV